MKSHDLKSNKAPSPTVKAANTTTHTQVTHSKKDKGTSQAETGEGHDHGWTVGRRKKETTYNTQVAHTYR